VFRDNSFEDVAVLPPPLGQLAAGAAHSEMLAVDGSESLQSMSGKLSERAFVTASTPNSR
jgi:hypothetical protein